MVRRKEPVARVAGEVLAKAVLQPTEREIAAARDAKARVLARPVRPDPHLAKDDDGRTEISAANGDENGMIWRTQDTFASDSTAFAGRHLNALIGIGGATTEELGAALAFVAAVEPRNEMEAALAVQMYATHDLALKMLQRCASARIRPELTEYGNLATKAQRTFTAQIEALAKLRSGGKQIVEHRHIYIDNRGGQAVVTDQITPGGSARGQQIEDQSHALGSAMLGHDANGRALPIAEGKGAETLSNARRKGRGATGKR